VYLLSVLSARPRLLICDDLLCGLDVDRQSDFLSLLQKLQVAHGLGIVYMTVDVTSFKVMSHNGAFMKNGVFVEQGDPHELIEKPKLPESKYYFTCYKENEEKSRGKNLANAYALKESVFNL
jgi:ABC-type dipeptide/oligopeptide/nickel transport system ATPase component